MEIKLELDTKKATCAAMAIAAVYALCRVSEHSNSPQLAAANAIALIIIIAILYGPHLAPKKNQHAQQLHLSRQHPPVHQHVRGCAKTGNAG
jgi:hypothetical protein